MRHFLLVLAALSLLGSAGCFSVDRRHNRNHIKYIKQDLLEMHKEIDKVFAWDQRSGLRDVENP